MSSPPVFTIIKMLFNPDVSKKMILQIAYGQIQAIGYAKVLAALAGAGIVGASSVIRIPQILKILKPKDVHGRVKVVNELALEGIGLETLSQLVHVVFNRQSNSSFISYGESLLLGLQNVAIILLIKFYRLRAEGKLDGIDEHDGIARAEIVATQLAPTIGVILGTSLFLTKIAPSSLISLVEILGIPISVISKIPQIRRNHALKSTSSLSDITIRANLLGSLLRVFTSVQDYKGRAARNKAAASDKILVAGYSASLIMNAIIVGQSIAYKNQDESEKSDKLN